jgi:hypothetical protein
MKTIFGLLICLAILADLFLAQHLPGQIHVNSFGIVEAGIDGKVTYLIIAGSLLGIIKLRKQD